MDNIINEKQRFAKMFWSSRAEAGKSQEYMAMGLNVSKKTIQNWEKGTSSPDFFQGIRWFELLGLNPMKWFMEFLYPSDDKTASNIDEDLAKLIDGLPEKFKEQLFFVFAGGHGSSPISLMQMLVAHCHNPMYVRYNVASIIESNYRLSEETDSIVCPNEHLPDMDLLHDAILKGRNAVVKNENGYTNV